MAASSPLTTGALQANSAGSGHANFGRLLLAEWTKLRSVRSTYWSLISLVVVFLFFSWLIPFLVVHNWDQASPSDKASLMEDPLATIMNFGILLGQLGVAVLGVLVTASEYSTGMIRSTLLASPHRMRMLAAKSVVFTVLVLIVGEIVAFAAFGIGQQTFKSLFSLHLNDDAHMRQVVGVGLYLGVLALFSLLVGSLIRHVAGAICTVIALVLVVGPLLQAIPGKAGQYLYTYEPTNAGYAVFQKDLPDKFLITAWEGFAVFAAWTAVLWVLAAWLLSRRDA
ncbi:ABC transporter permease [Actinospica robiniae]|uniref:ABC transporter permease n=1 Tax=Actinospica robiniae TaxID=304901 RepID=UPI000427F6FA|nr:ABC transporter permease [Actinospica robiniae]